MQINPSHEAMCAFFEAESEKIGEMVSEFRSGRHAMAPWKVVPAARLARIWEDAAREGFVRDTRGLDRIAAVFTENTLRLAVNCLVSGHTPVCAKEDLAEYFATEEEAEEFIDWAIDTPSGGWRISDYGLDPLRSLAAMLSDAETPEGRLVILDRMLSVTHQRSDLASWFVEGGTRTLSALAEGVRPSEAPEAAVPVP